MLLRASPLENWRPPGRPRIMRMKTPARPEIQ